MKSIRQAEQVDIFAWLAAGKWVKVVRENRAFRYCEGSFLPDSLSNGR